MAEKGSNRIQISVAILGGFFVITGAVISSLHWFKYFFPDQFKEKEAIPSKTVSTEKKESSETSETSGTESLSIKRFELTPVLSDIPSYLYFELKNEGTKTLKELTVYIDLGRSTYTAIDVIGNNIHSVDSTQSNQISITFSELFENDHKSIYLLLSHLVFNSIKIRGSNLNFNKEYSFDDLAKNEFSSEETSGFFIFLQILLGFILFIFAIFFVSMTYRYLYKKNLLDWS